MKTAQHIVSKNGILSVVTLLLTTAFALACTSVTMSLSVEAAPSPLAYPNGQTIVMFIFGGVFGRIPSTASTLESMAMFVAYVVTPSVALAMIAARYYLRRRAALADVR